MMKHLVALCLFFATPIVWSQEAVVEQTAEAFQADLNTEFANPAESPLTAEDLKAFKALDFYPIDAKYRVEAVFVRTPNEKIFKMKTSTTRAPEYVKYGELRFVLDGKACQLNLYQNIELVKKEGFADYLFLPFFDLSCGKESYIGGRYLDLRIPKGNTIIIDFNKAYNPYCAYNHKYSCPIVPLENNLDLAILAGVKKFHD
jgi:uncharacterized protein (DUF1684 family)